MEVEMDMLRSRAAKHASRMRSRKARGEGEGEGEGEGAGEGGEGEGENPAVRETFTLFEDPETIERHRYLLLDGRPALLATTSKANKLGIFEEQKARVFRLAADRTFDHYVNSASAGRFERMVWAVEIDHGAVRVVSWTRTDEGLQRQVWDRDDDGKLYAREPENTP